jgi:hypothetical protein
MPRLRSRATCITRFCVECQKWLPSRWRRWLAEAVAEEESELEGAIDIHRAGRADVLGAIAALLVVVGARIAMEQTASTFGGRQAIPEIVIGGLVLASVTSVPTPFPRSTSPPAGVAAQPSTLRSTATHSRLPGCCYQRRSSASEPAWTNHPDHQLVCRLHHRRPRTGTRIRWPTTHRERGDPPRLRRIRDQRLTRRRHVADAKYRRPERRRHPPSR